LFSIYSSFLFFIDEKYVYLMFKSEKKEFLSPYLIQYLWWNWGKKMLFKIFFIHLKNSFIFF